MSTFRERSANGAAVRQQESNRIAIVVPVYDDWGCFALLLDEIGNLPGGERRFSIFIVDDCSTVGAPERLDHLPASVEQVEVFRLHSNVGHQRAIAVGLSVVAERERFDAVVVMDVDGEDKPCDILRLLERHSESPHSLIVAQRQKRSETASFRFMYQSFKAMFRVLTGRTIDFGNFCLIPASYLDRLIYMRELWNHLSATLLKSRLPIVKLPTERGVRYVGKSSMSWSSLIIHGFSAVAVFMDTVFVRLIILCSALIALAASVAMFATLIRLGTTMAIPGWTTNVVGVSAIIAFQALTLLSISAIMMLANRSAMPSLPGRDGKLLVESCRLIGSRDSAGE